MLNLTISDNVYEDLLNTLNGAKTGLTIGHINVNGLRGKIAEIRYLLSEVKFDVIAITETHLSSDIENNEILVDDYNIIRQDRDNGRSSWGGTAIYFKCSLNGYCKININKFQIESSWLELNIRSQTVLIGSVYNPPGNNKIFIESFDKALQVTGLAPNCTMCSCNRTFANTARILDNHTFETDLSLYDSATYLPVFFWGGSPFFRNRDFHSPPQFFLIFSSLKNKVYKANLIHSDY